MSLTDHRPSVDTQEQPLEESLTFVSHRKSVVDSSHGTTIDGEAINSPNKVLEDNAKLPDKTKKESSRYLGKGIKMASDISDFLILKARIGASSDKMDKKRLFKTKDDFMKDCKYNLCTFEVTRTTEFFRNIERDEVHRATRGSN